MFSGCCFVLFSVVCCHFAFFASRGVSSKIYKILGVGRIFSKKVENAQKKVLCGFGVTPFITVPELPTLGWGGTSATSTTRRDVHVF